MNNRRNAARRGLTKLGLLVILTALSLFGLIGYKASSKDSNSTGVVAIASQSTSVAENQTDLEVEETHSEPDEEEVYGDPDPDTLRKPGDPVPRAVPGGRYTQQELDDMASSYDLSYEAEQRAQAEEKIQQASLPFTPQGSATMVGRWGRNTRALLSGAVEWATFNYSEIQFDGDGTFIQEGYDFGKAFKQVGVYQIAEGNLMLCYTGEYVDGVLQNYVKYNVVKGKVYEENDWTKLDVGPIHTYNKGLRWDYNSNPQCYRDEQGNQMFEVKK